MSTGEFSVRATASMLYALGTRFCALKILFFLLLLNMSSSAGTFSVSTTTSISSPTGELNSVWAKLSLSLLLDKLRVCC